MLHCTCDEMNCQLNDMRSHVEGELEYCKKDEQYFDEATLKHMFKLRDALKVACDASVELIKIAIEGER